MTQNSEQTTTNPQKQNEDIQPSDLSFTNIDAARIFASNGDSIQRFRLQSRLDIYDRLTKHFEAGTALYEKLILLDGAIIALSITFLGSLSSRLVSIQNSPKPHLWMVGTSWLLLLASIFCSYRTIVERHGAGIRYLTSISAEIHQYVYRRLGETLRGLASVIKGEINSGTEKAQLSDVFEGLSTALKGEGDATIKKMNDSILEGRKQYREVLYAHLAIYLALAGIALLCWFTIMSLQMWF